MADPRGFLKVRQRETQPRRPVPVRIMDWKEVYEAQEKGVLKSQKEGRAHLYEPVISKEDYQIQSLQHLVQNVFDGTPTLLVQRLVSSEQLDPEELDRIRRSLRRKER